MDDQGEEYSDADVIEGLWQAMLRFTRPERHKEARALANTLHHLLTMPDAEGRKEARQDGYGKGYAAGIVAGRMAERNAALGIVIENEEPETIKH